MGFLDDAGVDVAKDVPNDPYGFGNKYWRFRLVELGEPKVTEKGDKIGMKATWVVEDPAFDGKPIADPQKGIRGWIELPPPVAMHESLGWDKDSARAKTVLFNFTQILRGLGFAVDEYGNADQQNMVGRLTLAKANAKQNDQGFWQVNLNNYKPVGSDSGSDEFTKAGQSNGDGLTDEERLQKELGQG